MAKQSRVSNRKLQQSRSSNSTSRLQAPTPTISTGLLNLTVIITPIAFLSVFFLPNYFSISAGNKMIFSPADGNCVLNTSGFGSHCFGDYGATINLIREIANPWFAGSVLGHYPPLNLIIYRFFSDLQPVLSHTLTLSLYLVTILLSGLYPIWSASRKYLLHERQSNILFLGLLALPLLAALDRGNNAVWAIPFLYLAITNLLEGKINRSIIFFSISIALRPQLVIFLILYLLSRRYLAFVKTFALVVSIYILSFTTYLLSFNFKTIVTHIQATRDFGSGVPGTWPPNLSLARGLKVSLEWFSVELKDDVIILISTSIIMCVLLCIYFLKEPLRIRNAVFLLIPLVFLLAPMTWYYYGSFLVVAIALLIKERLKINDLFRQQNLTYTYLGGLIITNSVLFLPVLTDYNNIIQYVVPVYWCIFYVSFTVQNLAVMIKSGLRNNASQ